MSEVSRRISELETPPTEVEVAEVLRSLSYLSGPQADVFRRLVFQRDRLLELLRVAYRQMSGDYTDGGEYRDDRTVITMLHEELSKKPKPTSTVQE